MSEQAKQLRVQLQSEADFLVKNAEKFERATADLIRSKLDLDKVKEIDDLRGQNMELQSLIDAANKFNTFQYTEPNEKQLFMRRVE